MITLSLRSLPAAWALMALAAAAMPAASGLAQAPATQPAAAPKPAPATAPAPVSVAILSFDANLPGGQDLGKQIADTLNATLSSTDGITLVDRSALDKVLAEHALNLTGLVEADKAVRVGKLVGAKILVTGRAFVMGKQLFVTAKIIGTETSLVEGVLVKGPDDADVGTLVLNLTDKIAASITTHGGRLIASDDALTDPIPAFKAKLAKLKKPTLSVNVSERHLSTARPIDPAVETELRSMLTDAGFSVVDSDKVAGPDVGINLSGEAFSEAGPQIGPLSTSSARAEIKLVNHGDGKIVFTDRATTRAVDLSEAIAGKKALEKAGHALGLRILEYFTKNLPPAEPAAK